MSLYDVAREVTEEVFGKGSYSDPRTRVEGMGPRTLSQAISLINLRKQNLDHICERSRDSEEVKIREQELTHVLEILGRVRL